MYIKSNFIPVELYNKYKLLTEKENRYILGGRLAEYKYYDMHQIIGSALNKVKKELELK